ncbi:hypothetical protein JCM8202_001498 [Rhodotorula sphaerocarpa]
MAAFASSSAPSPHLDLVSAVAFSPRGSHLATASLDHHVRIAHPSPTTVGAWDYCPRTWKAHDGAVLSLAWADPEFGTVLASGGVDGVVKVWRQVDPPPSPRLGRPQPDRSANKSSSTAGPGWALAAALTDSRGTVRSLSFAPTHFGLKLAAVASDSHLRVWECLDPTKGLREWTLTEDVDLASLGLAPSTGGGTVYAASPGAGYETGSTGPRSYGSEGPASGLSSNAAFPSTSATASPANSSPVAGPPGGATASGRAGATIESDGGWAVSWCPEHWWGERLAVSSGPNGVIRLFHFSRTRPWHNYLNLLPSHFASTQGISTADSTPVAGLTAAADPLASGQSASSPLGSGTSTPEAPAGVTHTPPTSSLAFAPPSGRSYLPLAAGARDGRARVWRIVRPPVSLPNAATSAGPTGGDPGEEDGGAVRGEEPWSAWLEVELDLVHAEGGAGFGRRGTSSASGPQQDSGSGGAEAGKATRAVRVDWNVFGTVLSTTGGEDGRTRLWKPIHTGQWRQVAVLSAHDPPTPA